MRELNGGVQETGGGLGRQPRSRNGGPGFGATKLSGIHHRHRDIAGRVRAVAELTKLVVSPAVDGAAGPQPAGGGRPPPPRGEAQPTGDRHRNTARRERAVAELAKIISSPAVGGPAGRQPAGGVTSPLAAPRRVRAHRGEAKPTRDRHRHIARRERAVAELTKLVVSPAVGGPAGREPAGA